MNYDGSDSDKSPAMLWELIAAGIIALIGLGALLGLNTLIPPGW